MRRATGGPARRRPARRRSRPRPRGRTPGFTILELVVVLLVLALGAAVAVPAFRAPAAESDLARATRRVTELFRAARDSALRGGRPITVVIDAASAAYWIDAPVRELPPTDPGAGTLGRFGGSGGVGGLGAGGAAGFGARTSAVTAAAGMWTGGLEPPTPLVLPALVELQASRGQARFTILPNGTAFADSLVLRAAGAVRIVTLDPWTGDVVVH